MRFIWQKWNRISLIMLLIFSATLCGCGKAENRNDEETEAFKNKNHFLQTFATLYMREPDVVITDDSIEYGDLACDDCTWVKCDAYTTNGDQFLWHNLAVINSEGKITWYFYDDKDFANYRMKENPHNLIDVTNKKIITTGYYYTDLDFIDQSYKAWDNFDMGKFLPDKKMRLNYSSVDGDYSVEVTPQGDSVDYMRIESSGDVREGELRYDYHEWALFNKEFLKDGRENEIRYAVPGGKGYENSDGSYVSAEVVLFTITTPAGVFEDCYATPFEDVYVENSDSYVLKFYAPGVGHVLSLDVKPDHKYTLLEQLVSIEDITSNELDDEESIEQPDQENETLYEENDSSTFTDTDLAYTFFDGQRFECFETISGEDVIMTVHLMYSGDSNIPSRFKGEMSSGVEFWFEPYNKSDDNLVFKIDCMDGTKAYMKCTPYSSEIVFTAEEGTEYGNMYGYSGTYVGLPDADEIE